MFRFLFDLKDEPPILVRLTVFAAETGQSDELYVDDNFAFCVAPYGAEMQFRLPSPLKRGASDRCASGAIETGTRLVKRWIHAIALSSKTNPGKVRRGCDNVLSQDRFSHDCPRSPQQTQSFERMRGVQWNWHSQATRTPVGLKPRPPSNIRPPASWDELAWCWPASAFLSALWDCCQDVSNGQQLPDSQSPARDSEKRPRFRYFAEACNGTTELSATSIVPTFRDPWS